MNVLFISPLYSTFIHSQVVRLLEMEDISGRAEFLVRAYAWMRSPKYRCSFSPDKLRVVIPEELSHLLVYPNFPRDWLLHRNADWIAGRILQRYKEGAFDLIHAHTLHPAGTAAIKIARKWGIPVVITTHGADFYRLRSEVTKTRAGRPYDPQTARLVRSALHEANRIIAVSPSFAEEIASAFPQASVEMIPNSYDSTIFTPGDKQLARKELSIPEDEEMLLSVGHYTKTKGFEYLIGAVPCLVEKHPRLNLHLIGSGELKESFIELIRTLGMEKHVQLHPPVQHEKLTTWYRATDIYLQPSLSETFGLTLAEAQACGAPAIASLTAGPKYILGKTNGGILVAPMDTDALVRETGMLLECANVRELHAQMATDNAKLHLTYQEVKIRELYRELLK